MLQELSILFSFTLGLMITLQAEVKNLKLISFIGFSLWAGISLGWYIEGGKENFPNWYFIGPLISILFYALGSFFGYFYRAIKTAK